VQRIFLDASRAKRVLGWMPKVAFTEGLRRTVEWSRKHPLPVRG
jgi:nucleoside-diphosphate-sugar epimerase